MGILSVLLVGDPRCELFGRAAESFTKCEIRKVQGLEQAAAFVTDQGYFPELVVLVQSRPGEFSSVRIDALRAIIPLARIWRLLDSWCEGEQRSGRPPAGCTNIYAHQWPARVARELAARDSRLPAIRSGPVTMTFEERLLSGDGQPLPKQSGLVVVCAPHSETATALAELCRSGGYDTLVVAAHQRWNVAGAKAILWDCPIEEATDADHVAQLRAAAGGAPLFAMLSFPRGADWQRAIEAGVAGVISKPFLSRDLFWHLGEVEHPARISVAA